MWRVLLAAQLALCLASIASAQPSDLLGRTPNLKLKYGPEQRENDNLARIDEWIGALGGLANPANPVIGVASGQRLGMWDAASLPQYSLDVASSQGKTVIAARGQHPTLGAGFYLASDVGVADLRFSTLAGAKPWTLSVDMAQALPSLDFCPSFGCVGFPTLRLLPGAGLQVGSAGDNKAIDQILSGTLTTDFASVSGACGTPATVTVAGATTGEAVTLGVPNTAMASAGCTFQAWVSAADTVSVKVCSVGVACDPPAANYRVIVTSIGN